MVTVKYDDLSLAFDFVSSAAPTEHRAYVSLDTGRIFWVSELNPVEEEELPDDLETSDRYVEIPHPNDLELGKRLALRFAAEQLAHLSVEVEVCFRRPGAYARFKELLAREHCLEKWYAFETESTRRALREWCAANAIELADSPRGPTAGEAADQDLESLLEAFADAWNRHDVEALMSMMTDDGVFEASAGDHVNGERHEGQRAVRAAFEAVFTQYPDARWADARHFVRGNRGVSEWTFSGTREDGRRVEVAGCDLLTFRDGKIAAKNSFRKHRPPIER